MQEYTSDFQKKSIQMGKGVADRDLLMEYVSGLHSHLRKPVLLAKLANVDEACMQAHYLETDKKNSSYTSQHALNKQGDTK